MYADADEMLILMQPDNVLLNDTGRCHLTDFGCAKAFAAYGHDGSEAMRLTDTVGTYQFLAPECCSGEPYDPFKVDIWAVGVVYFIFLFGRLPFTSESARELFDEITRAEVVLPGPDESRRDQPVSPEARDLLHRLLEKDPRSGSPSMRRFATHGSCRMRRRRNLFRSNACRIRPLKRS